MSSRRGFLKMAAAVAVSPAVSRLAAVLPEPLAVPVRRFVVWAEPETAGEMYIPLAGRPGRAAEILEETRRMFER